MKIERVVKKDDENVIVWLDNQEKLYLSYEVFLQNRLKKDMDISEDGFAFLIRENQKYFIKKKAFDFLGRRLHSYTELKLKLLRKKYDKELISEVLDYLSDKKFLDDYEFGKQYAEEKVRLKSWGKNKIKSELFKRGIPSHIIDRIIGEDGYSSIQNAETVAAKKMKILIGRKYEKKVLSSKLYTYLLSKGYEYDTVKEVIKKLIDEQEII